MLKEYVLYQRVYVHIKSYILIIIKLIMRGLSYVPPHVSVRANRGGDNLPHRYIERDPLISCLYQHG